MSLIFAKTIPRYRSRLFFFLYLLYFNAPVQAQFQPNDPQTLRRIRESIMQDDWMYEQLTNLTDLAGPRLAGSPGAAAAVDMVANSMRLLGASVTLQPVKVPHWVRGTGTGEIVAYTDRPAGVVQNLVLTALGGSAATPSSGVTAPVVIVRDLEELQRNAERVKGAIVLFNVPFDQGMADRGYALTTYLQASAIRSAGPEAAAKLGAVGALVRSVGGANFRLPHTGNTRMREPWRIPAAAVTAEDALLISRLAARGPLQVHFTLTPQILQDADSFNVIADWPGTDRPDQVVIVSGHLDSWDLGTGATDDGSAITTAMGVISTLHKLGLHPKRTIRFIGWMNEENGATGSKAYFATYNNQLSKHVAAIESDIGAGRPFGIMGSIAPSKAALFSGLQDELKSIGAGVFETVEKTGMTDTRPLEDAGVPVFAPVVDTHAYFDYHHTAADTLDKVDAVELKRQTVVMTLLAWFLANLDDGLETVPGR